MRAFVLALPLPGVCHELLLLLLLVLLLLLLLLVVVVVVVVLVVMGGFVNNYSYTKLLASSRVHVLVRVLASRVLEY